jgi:hypothetical protein
MLTVLNLAIGLTFVYLVVSLVVSAFNELVLTSLDKRADFLKEGLQELLGDSDRVKSLLEHGLVDALSRKKNGTPSYIGPEAFTAAVLDQIKPATTAAVRTIEDFKSGIGDLPDGKLKQSLTSILDQADDDITAFKQGIAAWYDRSMDRVTGWYKRYTQKWLFCLAFFLAVGCNVDTIHIVQTLSANPTLAAEIADSATKYATANSTPNAATQAAPASNASIERLMTNVQNNLATLNSTGVPIGWDPQQRTYYYEAGNVHVGHLIGGILGWFVTALAASLGAPFWFDTLQKFVNIRSNGRAPDEKDLSSKK